MSYYFGDLKAKKGDIHIVRDRCKGCGFCVEYCPGGVLEMSVDFNSRGYHPPKIVKEDKCVYCQLCEAICPEFAIYVTLKRFSGVQGAAFQKSPLAAGGKKCKRQK